MTESESNEQAAESEPVLDILNVSGDLRARILDEEPIVGNRHVYLLASTVDLDTTRFAAGARVLVRAASDTSIDRLMSALTPTVSVPSAAVLEQARRNVELRERVIAQYGALSAKEVADLAGSSAANRGQYAHVLSREQRVFSVNHRRQVLYPAFQFDSDGEPLPVIASLLPLLRERFTRAWEIAVWFVNPNSWLNGQKPVDLLGELDEAVIEAARAGLDRGGF